MKLGLKITLTFFLIAFISMLVVGIISYTKARFALQEESFSRLTAVREMKATQIKGFFEEIKNQILVFSEDRSVIEAMKEFGEGYNNMDKELKDTAKILKESVDHLDTFIDSTVLPHLNKHLKEKVKKEQIMPLSCNAIILQDYFMASNPFNYKPYLDSIPLNCSYNRVHKKFHPEFREFLERFDYYDIFLIDTSGNIIYTVYKEIDFATSLRDKRFKHTKLDECFEMAMQIVNKKEVAVVDFSSYKASYNAPAAFMAAPIFDNGQIVGVLAFQMPIHRIDNIMTNDNGWSKVGLGKTGETYLVGNDFTLRNQSRFLIEDSANYIDMLENSGVNASVINKIIEYNSTIGLQEVRTEATELALKGVSDTRILKNYRGNSVLSAFSPLNVLGMNWVILSEIDYDEAVAHAHQLRHYIIISFAILLFFVFMISYFISKSLSKPLKELTLDAQELAKGNFEIEIKASGKDEIGILAQGFKKMQISISNLIHGLEDKVRERTAEVTRQKEIIEEKQKEIVDSINYAKRIQYTLLAHDAFLKKYLNDFFILFHPKDIVSGDFYWAAKTENKFYLAVCDSTGHGVPGAFMSLLNISFLNEAITEKKISQPNEILNHVRERLITNISKDGGQDGMDGILLCIDTGTKEITYAAAQNAPVILRNGEIMEHEADKMPIGKGIRDDSFKLFKLDVKKNDTLLLYTDGYADQFGGPKGKKFKYKQLNELFIKHQDLSMNEQRDKLLNIFEDWKGNLEQVDDVCIIGIKF